MRRIRQFQPRLDYLDRRITPSDLAAMAATNLEPPAPTSVMVIGPDGGPVYIPLSGASTSSSASVDSGGGLVLAVANGAAMSVIAAS